MNKTVNIKTKSTPVAKYNAAKIPINTSVISAMVFPGPWFLGVSRIDPCVVVHEYNSSGLFMVIITCIGSNAHHIAFSTID